MSVRRMKRRDPISGARREFWMVDVDFQHADGSRQRVRKVSPVHTRRGAEQYERDLRNELLAGTFGKKEAPTFEQFVVESWWPTYPRSVGNAPSTVVEKEHHLRLHLKPELAKVRLDRIKGEVVDRLFAAFREKKLSEKTIKNVRATLRRVLASAVEWGVLDVVPQLPRVRVPDPSFDFLTADESERLLAASPEKDRFALLLFALHTGARAGEQLAFEWGDVDWQSRTIRIRRAISAGVVGPTKNKLGRAVPMTDRLEAALKAIRHLKGQTIFSNDDGSTLKHDQLHERLWTACRRAGLRRIKWHELRHTFASQLAIAGVPLRQVQEWLGHGSIQMTMRYSHLSPSGGRDLIRLLDGNSRNHRHESAIVPAVFSASPRGFEPLLQP